ncbi:hypothetical protein [Bordetella bronchiseptica]|uniref:hypothetical protein n=1 Tax=Bordetella bronchiseptica TaxID=518 RepID=UPI003EDC6D95
MKALLRQAHLQETVRDRLLLEWARCKSSAEQHRLLRQARGIGRELHDTLGAIYRLEKDTRQGFPALIVPDELALADAAPPALASPLERVTASDQTYEVFEAEFAELMDKAQQTARPELLWVEDLPTDKPVELLTLSEEDAEAGVSPGLAALIGLEKAREAVGE